MKLAAKQSLDRIAGYLLVLLLIVPTKLTGLILRRNHKTGTSEPGAILVLKILGFGSILMASDALWSLKKRYPNTRLILLCGKGVKAGAEPLGLFDEIWSSDDRNLFTLAGSGLSCLFKTWRIKRLWVLDLEVYSKLTTVFATLTFAYNRFGFYLNEVWFRYNLNTHNIYFNQFCAVELNYRSIISAMGVSTFEPFYIPAFRERKRPENFSHIAVNNTCSELGTERKMPAETLAAVCTWITKNTPYKVALLGAPSDKHDNELFLQQYCSGNARIENMAGKLNFRDYYAFLFEHCVMMLTIDSAPLHIARKLGLPTVSLWGPTNPDTRIVSDNTNAVVYLHAPCSPCVHHTEILPCGGDNFCMKQMKDSVIIAMVQTFLKTA